MDLFGRLNRTAARYAAVKTRACEPFAPTLSVTFDDFPRSAWTNARKVLERHGALATYYVAGRFCGASEKGLEYFQAGDLKAVIGAGHEIGCHTFSHIHAPRMGEARFVADCDRNAAFLAPFLGGRPLETFAYPYGDVCVRSKRLAAQRFVTARGIRADVNGGSVDLALLASMPLERRSWSAARWRRLVEDAAGQGGWLTLFTHDVSDDPTPHGCTPAMLDEALTLARDHGLRVLTVGAAAARLPVQALAA
ncbi:MAG TPA: polysaccharide deacetylase family protein [Caulobacteraceae bacterium]